MKKTKFTKFDAADYLTDEESIAAYLHEVLKDLDRIQINPDRMNGQPTIRDLRLTVHRVLELVELYPDRAELKAEFPELEDEDIQQAIMYAASNELTTRRLKDLRGIATAKMSTDEIMSLTRELK